MERLSTLTRDLNRDMAATDLARWLSCLLYARGNTEYALAAYDERYPRTLHRDLIHKHVGELHTKAAVAVGTTTDATWAKPITPPALVNLAFVPLLAERSLFGRTPGLRAVPFGMSVPRQTADGSYTWVGENTPKPITKLAFDNVTLAIKKAVGLVVVTAELLKLSARGTEQAVLDAIASGVALFVDRTFLDPTQAASAASPGSITNGIAAVPSTANLNADIAALMAAFFTSRPGRTRPRFSAHP